MAELYTLKEAAAMLRVCESTMRTLCRTRKIRFIRLRNAQRSYRFTRQHIDEFLRAGEQFPSREHRNGSLEAAKAAMRECARKLGY